MQEGVARLLDRLWREGDRLSRNRNFELFEGQAERRARRAHLRLRQLERELRSYRDEARVLVLEEGARAIVEVELPALRFRRRIFLERLELQLLREDPILARLLVSDSR